VPDHLNSRPGPSRPCTSSRQALQIFSSGVHDLGLLRGAFEHYSICMISLSELPGRPFVDRLHVSTDPTFSLGDLDLREEDPLAPGVPTR